MDLLLIEDNKKISEFMVQGLEESGYFVTLCENGVDAREKITLDKWDVIVMDIMLPDIDGLELLQYSRFKKIYTPILLVSALGETEDKVKALDYGADDYLAKPFHFRELVARVNALTRRAGLNATQTMNDGLQCRDLFLYVNEHRVKRGETSIELTLQEFKLLRLLMENVDKVMSRTEILNSVWGMNHNSNTNIVDVYISYLRNKIEIEGSPKLIETVKGRGYIIRSKEL